MATHLTSARIEDFGGIHDISLEDLSRGLTGVYGANGSGKTTFLQFLRGAFGDRSGSFWNHAQMKACGDVEVQSEAGRREITVRGKEGGHLLSSTPLARLATVSDFEAHSTELVEQLASQLGVSLEDESVDVSREQNQLAALKMERAEFTGPSGPIAKAEEELAHLDATLSAARAEQSRTEERLASQRRALQAAYVSTHQEAERLHGDYQSAQTDLGEWQADAWRARRVSTRVESIDVVTQAPNPQNTATSLRAALIEIAQLRCKASARRADAAAAGPLELCGPSLSQPLQLADEIRVSLDRLRGTAGTVPADGISSRVDDLIASLSERQRAVDWLVADRTRVLLDRCERDLEEAALSKCSVCGEGTTACDERTCTTIQNRTIEEVEPAADAERGAWLAEQVRMAYRNWQAALVRHRQARRHLDLFDADRQQSPLAERIANLLAARDALLQRLTELRSRLGHLNVSIAELEAFLAEDRPPSGPLFEAGRYFRQLTCNQYSGLSRSRTGRGELYAISTAGHRIALKELSRGTCAQAALAIRLAVLDVVAEQGEQPPLILDDVLVDSDRERARAGIDLLIDWGRNRQVLLVTCQRQLIDLMREAQTPIKLLGESKLSATAVVAPASKAQGAIEIITDARKSAKPARQSVAKIVAKRTEEPTYWLDPDSMIIRLLSVTETDARKLRSIGLDSVEHLMLVDVDEIESDLVALQITPTAFARWQGEARLMTLVPGLSARDAQLLAWAGIWQPQELATIEVIVLRERLTALANQKGASHLRVETEAFSTDRLNRWRSRASKARSSQRLFQRRPKLRSAHENRRDRRRGMRPEIAPAPARPTPTSGRSTSTTPSTSTGTARTLSVVERRQFARSNRTVRTGGTTRSSSVAHASASSAGAKAVALSETVIELRYYLEVHSPVVDAPSIGPKTAKRLAKLKVKTVSDLLTSEAKAISDGLDDRRFKRKTIVDWQDQARLMCQIPMLRGHDAQVLVACEFRDPAKIAASTPEQLFAVVGPYVKTKEAQRLLRSSKVPDLAEVTDWISWARQGRALEAA